MTLWRQNRQARKEDEKSVVRVNAGGEELLYHKVQYHRQCLLEPRSWKVAQSMLMEDYRRDRVLMWRVLGLGRRVEEMQMAQRYGDRHQSKQPANVPCGGITGQLDDQSLAGKRAL